MGETPLEERKLSVADGIVPALDSYWVGDVSFLPFQPISALHHEEESLDWRSSADLIITDLQWLLNQPCHVFWSHLIFDDSLRASLDSFLKLAPRGFDGVFSDIKVVTPMEKLYSMYFKVFVRMTTCKESAEDFFTPSVFGTILYDNFILDFPKILDLCALYGPSNERILSKMIENVFRHQPNYLYDVGTAIPHTMQLFDELIERLTDNKLTVARGLTTPNPETSTADVDVLDLCLYASDMCHSLCNFLRIYPPACIQFHTPAVYKTICLFYGDVLHRLLEQLKSTTLGESTQRVAYKRLTLAQDDSVSLFRHILFTSTLGKALRESEPSSNLIQDYYDVLSEYLGETRFIGHYSSKFSFSEDTEIISQLHVYKDSDHTRQLFIRDGLIAAQSQRDEEAEMASNNRKQPAPPAEVEEDSENDADEGNSLPSASALPTPVQSIRDMFPDLGVGFIEMCLRHYQSADHVIHALLEESLPASLAKLERNLAIALDEDSLVSSRRNVYDNDEFDVFRERAIDTTKVHRGKRTNTLNKEDNSFNEKIKDLVTGYDEMSVLDGGAAFVGSSYNDFMYDDEYDDTYDSNEVGADDADEALELMGRRMVVPVALGGSGFAEEVDEGAANTTNNREVDNSKPPDTRPKYDVKGRAKGQGQSADVTRNRNFKTAHKARGANHNRKAGARSKMSKGMF